jgi:hypothetical protein
MGIKTWFALNPPADFIPISRGRRVACGLPPDSPIYDVEPEPDDMINKRVKTYRDPIVLLNSNGTIEKEYFNTPELESDGYKYQPIKVSINNRHVSYDRWWMYRSQYDAMSGLQRLMHMSFAKEGV